MLTVTDAWTGDYDNAEWVLLEAKGHRGAVQLNIPTMKASILAASLLVSAQEAGRRLPVGIVAEKAEELAKEALQQPIEVIGAQIITGAAPVLLLNIGIALLRFELLPEAFSELCATVANAGKGEPGLM